MGKSRYYNLIRHLLGLTEAETPPKGETNGRPLTYDEAERLSQDENPEIRAQLASYPHLFPEILQFLSADPDPRVRCEVAGNIATLERANLLLAQDTDEQVRVALADKICRLIPNLSPEEQQNLSAITLEALNILSRDHVIRIRRLIAEALKEVVMAPSDIIHRLARDAELEVCAPVLQHSPLLTDEDLILIIHSQPVTGALSAISRRVPVEEPVSDAIVASHDIEAIATLLENHSALIREQTLDFLMDKASRIPAWHEPLVKRPYLPPVAALRLATFVATDLLDSLRGRIDLSPEIVDAVSQIVHKRLNRTINQPPSRDEEATTPLEVAESMYKSGSLNERVFLSALSSGNRDFAIATLVARSGLPLKQVKKILTNKNPLEVVALTWKSGLSSSCAEAVQIKLAHIPLDAILIMERKGIYSLSVEEMKQALEPYLS